MTTITDATQWNDEPVEVILMPSEPKDGVSLETALQAEAAQVLNEMKGQKRQFLKSATGMVPGIRQKIDSIFGSDVWAKTGMTIYYRAEITGETLSNLKLEKEGPYARIEHKGIEWRFTVDDNDKKVYLKAFKLYTSYPWDSSQQDPNQSKILGYREQPASLSSSLNIPVSFSKASDNPMRQLLILLERVPKQAYDCNSL